MNTIIDCDGNYTFTVGGYFLAIELLKFRNLFDSEQTIATEQSMKDIIELANTVKRNNNYVKEFEIPIHL